MNFIILSFYYPPDLSAGSFRSNALTKALGKTIGSNWKIHVITTTPNRYQEFQPSNFFDDKVKNIVVHKIKVPNSKKNFISEIYNFSLYSLGTVKICFNLKPKFILSTSSRFMTALLGFFISFMFKSKLFIDLRDIFSETISELSMKRPRTLSVFLKFGLLSLEKIVLSRAVGVNIVSKGFLSYYKDNGVDTSDWSFFPNGIDEEFINLISKNNKSTKSKKIVTYAGNIGKGQALEKILPKIALSLLDTHEFHIIGSGSSKTLLEDKISEYNLINIKIYKPMSREDLIKFYSRSDMFFLHLEELEAFKRVIPSKVFEYGAMGKPIIAGISGHSREFFKKELSFLTAFDPLNAEQCIQAFKEAEFVRIEQGEISKFIDKFSRTKIMNNFANHIVNII